MSLPRTLDRLIVRFVLSAFGLLFLEEESPEHELPLAYWLTLGWMLFWVGLCVKTCVSHP